jgi:hypothetical protein
MGAEGVFHKMSRSVGSQIDAQDLICAPCPPISMCTEYVPFVESVEGFASLFIILPCSYVHTSAKEGMS